ncbi:hypothetical protein [Roseomonas genomospecies 6]|uniref:DUF3102 domain-containing protein n=1 Tax=Roseomonas genomospecies 6 TaxID=214106 RepID=A0A9W7NFQ8_9PROT|nr:hypothetical protein [Roseomonas genomospecies 6]KAA0675675.1 hypothetical protein DS843_30535 [Roseomonas genomospecies 6]
MKKATKTAVSDIRFDDIQAPAPVGAVKSLAGESFEEAINRLLEESRERFVLVGEILLDWKASVPHGQFVKLINERIEAGALRNLSYQSANRYMTVAAALRNGFVGPDELPKESEAAYLLTSLKEDELKIAKREGLVRSTVRKAELTAFRKRLRAPSPAPLTDRRTELLREIARAKDEERRWAERRAELEAELAALS